MDHIMITGGSGMGKTTLANRIANDYGYKFISSSYSDLIPQTRDIPHSDMVNLTPTEEIMRNDTKLLSIRNKIFRDNKDISFVTDRSYLDSAAFWINKLSSKGVADCETETFLNHCANLLSEQCTHLIFIPASVKFLHEWDMEDNAKRITSAYYQFQISQLMLGVMDLWNYIPDQTWSYSSEPIYNMGYLRIKGKSIPTLILDEVDFEQRLLQVKRFLNKVRTNKHEPMKHESNRNNFL